MILITHTEYNTDFENGHWPISFLFNILGFRLFMFTLVWREIL